MVAGQKANDFIEDLQPVHHNCLVRLVDSYVARTGERKVVVEHHLEVRFNICYCKCDHKGDPSKDEH